MTAKVLCVGIATQDQIYAVEAMPDRPDKFRASDLAIIGGGTAATAAFAVARLGGEAMLASRLGDDKTGSDILAELEAERVDCSLLRRYPGHRSPSSAVMVDPQGERLVVCYADRSLPEEASHLPERLPSGVGAVLGDVSWIEGAKRLFAAARSAGVLRLIDGDRVVEDADYFDSATHIAYSAATLRRLTGVEDWAAGLATLARRAANWLAVTDGPRGTWFTENGAIVREPAPAVAAVDTLGAGDVFHGALALALAEGRPERDGVRFANAAAALKCTRFGGRAGTPSRAEVEAFMRGSG